MGIVVAGRNGQPQLPEQRAPTWPVLDRRDFVTAAGMSCGLAMMSDAVFAEPVLPVHAVVADTRFAASRAFAERAVRAGHRIAWIDGDITDFWYGELDLLWRREPAALVGLTAYGAFFCLERLAMDRGLRTAFKHEDRQADPVLIGWMLAPKRRGAAA